MTYHATIEYLYGLQQYGMKFGLDNISRLMNALGNPQRSFRTVHVAGTNGKGSTSAMIESMLRTAGVRTGLFTSPHLVSFTERIRSNGSRISEQDVIELADQVREAAAGIPDLCPTFFEVVTAMGFLYFRDLGVDWAVIEVGMGGRLDATNIIQPEACVINRIALDHRDFLGATLKEIANEKAGIIKKGIPVITAAQHSDAFDVIATRAAEKGCRFFLYGKDFSAVPLGHGPEGNYFTYHGSTTLPGLFVPLAGDHQLSNAALAIRTVETISERFPDLLPDINAGLRQTQWPGRLEMLSTAPPVLIDGAHNPDAAATLAHHLKNTMLKHYRRIILIIGIMADKDIDGILEQLLPVAEKVIAAAPAYGRAAQPEVLASRCSALGFQCLTAAGVAEAVRTAENLASDGDLIVITGSFYTIGEAAEVFGREATLSRLRE